MILGLSALQRPTEGERRLVLAYVVVTLFGALITLMALLRIGEGAIFREGLSRYDLWICTSGGIGAGIGLRLGSHRFGQPGLAGLGQALAGAVIVSFAGALIGGTLALPGYGTMFGPFTLAVTFAAMPLLAFLWLCTLGGVHLLMLGWRAERDSIFRAAVRT